MEKRINFLFLIALLLFIMYLGIRIFEPFFYTITFGIILTTLTFPIYRFICKIFKQKRGLAALVSCLLVIIVVLLPIFLLILVIADQSKETYLFISSKLGSGAFEEIDLKFLKDFIKKYAPFINVEDISLKEEIISVVKTVSTFLVNSTAKIITNIGTFLSNFFIMVFIMFFLYKDGEKFLGTITHLSPLPSSYESMIYKKFISVSRSIFLGVFLTAILQGIVGGVGFAIAGINPFLWGIFLAFGSIIPVIGNAIIWLPVGIVLIITGETGKAIFIMIWCFIFSLGIENGVKPYLIKGKTGMHPLIVFFSILGGLHFFGILGVILGPLIISFLILIIEIYEQQYKPMLDEMNNK